MEGGNGELKKMNKRKREKMVVTRRNTYCIEMVVVEVEVEEEVVVAVVR